MYSVCWSSSVFIGAYGLKRTKVGEKSSSGTWVLTMQPYFRNTPRGGKRMAIRMSQHVAKTPPFPMMTIASSSNESGSYKATEFIFSWKHKSKFEVQNNISSKKFFLPQDDCSWSQPKLIMPLRSITKTQFIHTTHELLLLQKLL